MEPSPLLRLPAEIRNLVSFYALTCTDPVILDRTFHKGLAFTRQSYLHHKQYPHLLALTATCRQLHSETGMMFYAANTFQCNPCPRSLSGPRFEDVLGPWRKHIGEEKWELIKQEGEVVIWHAFSDGYLCGSWQPEFRKVVCRMWDYAVETMGGVEGLQRMRLEFVLPKQMDVGPQVIELGNLEESWEKVLGELDEKLADQTVVTWMWRKGIGEQLRSARGYMLGQSKSLEVGPEVRSERK